jgi:AraC-like DNA-binding protein/tetratricopeptide (TPR) repeat protein
MTEPLTMDQIFIRKVTEIILVNLKNENFGVKELSHESGMSRSGLNRKLHRIANKSINQFIREVRLQKALEMLQNESVTASEVAYLVGFSSPAYFSTCFHEYFGYSPGKMKAGGSENPVERMITHIPVEQEQKKSVWELFTFNKSWILFSSVLIVIVAILVYLKIIRRDTLDDLRDPDGRISVAVMPFQNMTSDSIWNGIQIYLIGYLSNYEELKVRQKEAINSIIVSKGLTDYSSITPFVASKISQKLDANVFINGIISKTGTVIRVNAQLFNSKTKEVFKSFQIEDLLNEDEIFNIFDSLSVMVKNFLVISKMGKEINPDLKPYKYTSSPVAYKYFILADNAVMRNDEITALNYYSQAVAIDSNFIPAIIFLSLRYEGLGLYKDAKKWCLKAYKKRDKGQLKERIMAEWYYARLFETPFEEIKYLKQFQDFDDQVPASYWQTGNAYIKLFQYNKAIPEYEKMLEIYKKWGTKPYIMAYYITLGRAYHKTGQYKKEKKLYRKAEKDFPDNLSLLYRQKAILAFTEGDTVNANRYTEKYKSSLQDQSRNEADIVTNVASLYSQANILNKAEEYYRRALSLDSKNMVIINNLTYFLINNDRNINEGIDLIDAALKLHPNNHDFLHTKGLGFFKQGKYKEALEILQKSWNLRMRNAIYDHEAFLHLEEAKEAVSNQK